MSRHVVIVVVTVSLLADALFADFVTEHNKKRAGTGSSNMKKLRLSIELQQIAQAHANRCQNRKNPLASNQSTTFADVGENIHATKTYDVLKEYGVVSDWAKEGWNYRYSTNTCARPPCDSYKQLVRAETEFVGCGQAECDFGTFTVCNYAPRGNPDEVPFRRGGKCTNCTLGYSCDAAAEGLCYTPC
ncbi:uncharacterized protein LOC111129782 [Crassostrea virginica]